MKYSLDLSLNSPAVIKYDDTIKEILLFHHRKKLSNINFKMNNIKVQILRYPSLDSKLLKIKYTLDKIIKFINDPTLVRIESISFASNGRVIDLAQQNGAVLGTIMTLYPSCMIEEYSPSLIKKKFAGKGNIDKVGMLRAVKDKDILEIIEHIKEIMNIKNPTGKPIEDFVDSYALSTIK